MTDECFHLLTHYERLSELKKHFPTIYSYFVCFNIFWLFPFKSRFMKFESMNVFGNILNWFAFWGISWNNSLAENSGQNTVLCQRLNWKNGKIRENSANSAAKPSTRQVGHFDGRLENVTQIQRCSRRHLATAELSFGNKINTFWHLFAGENRAKMRKAIGKLFFE